jgi:hypothetical protein
VKKRGNTKLKNIMKQSPVCKIAGVSFTNDASDGGEQRQELLKQLYTETHKPCVVKLCHTKYHDNATGIDEDAIKVKAGGKLIGWIPKDKIRYVWAEKQMSCIIHYCKGTYSGELYYSKAPSSKQYAMVKDMHRNGMIPEMPCYDMACYTYAIIQAAKMREADT